ncbi:hypothetical protein ACO0OE_002206 [Hanseniaspora uvarum]
MPKITPNTHSRKYPFQVSPGPAVAALSDISINTNQQPNQIVKGIIAAEILETNQAIPLPLKKVHTMEEPTIHRSLPNLKIEVNIEDYIVNSEDNIVSCICDQNNPGDEDDEEKENESENEKEEQPEEEEEDDDDEDSSVNDVFWLQCDHCNRWVHGKCYGLKDDKDIDTMNFHCHICSPQDHPIAIKKFKSNVAKQLRNLAKVNANNKQNLKTKQKETVRKPSVKKSTVGNAEDDKKKETKSTGTTTSSKPKGGKEDSVKSEKESENKEPEDEPVDDTIKRVRLKNIRDLYGNIYYPLDKNQYIENYINEYLQAVCKKETDERFMLQNYPENFVNVKIDVKTPNAKSGDKFTGIPSLYVISKESIEEGDLIHEIIGKVGDQKNYIQDPKNQYRLLGVCKPKVLFHPKWPIYIDMRHAGNEVRYLRKSCHPNCEVVAALKPNETQPSFYLRALKDISSNEELTLAWQWDINHPIWKLVPGDHQLKYEKSAMKKRFETEYPDYKFDPSLPFSMDDVSEPESYFLVYCVDTILTMAECGCPNHKKCQLRNVKKYYNNVLKLKKSMSVAQMRYKTYDLLNKQKSKEPKQTSIINDMVTKEENRYVNRFNNYKSFVDRKRKLEEMSLELKDPKKTLYVDSTMGSGKEISTKEEGKKAVGHHLPSPLSPQQYKLEMIAQCKLQDALEDKVESIKKKQKISLENSIPKFINWIQNSKIANSGLLLKSAKVQALQNIILTSGKKAIDKTEIISNVIKGRDIITINEEQNKKLKQINELKHKEASLSLVNKSSSPGEDKHNSTFQHANVGSLIESKSDTKLTKSSSLEIETNKTSENIQVQPIKKKMSFADYRKKSKPN